MRVPFRRLALWFVFLLVGAAFLGCCWMAVQAAMHPRYYSIATIELRGGATAAQAVAVMPPQPSGGPTVSFAAVRNTGLFELTVCAEHPQDAANQANQLAVALQTSLAPGSVLIWEKAEAARSPGYPRRRLWWQFWKVWIPG
ncbi:MAG: hypothetical protein ABJF10_00430 [Chthoniobacter sp.]|uniref:hypothetical protein n=1 Tax=Chthoniobacter sp. TaxID=2510640 RepID=UPI0032ABA668